MIAKSGLSESRLSIRLLATATGALVWLIGTAMLMRLYGQPFPRAAILACISATAALLAWVNYHAISRRNDGLAIIMLSPFAAFQGARLPIKEFAASQIVLLAVLSSLAGVLARVLYKPLASNGKPSGSPLYDSEYDRLPEH